MTTWRMPAETDRQDRVWMAFPRRGSSLGSDEESMDGAYAAWSAVANAAVDFEPVTVVVDPSERSRARQLLSAAVDVVEAPLDDSWMRDIGPTFVLGDDGRLGAVDWVFNGWGAPAWATWGRDREIGRFVAEQAGATIVPSMLVAEGGALHVDGRGTVLTTETVLLDPGRNPYADSVRIEAELARTIGATTVIWLPRGLHRDYEDLGTRGHVDMVATIPSPGRILLHDQTNPEHPDHAVTAQIAEVLAAASTPDGSPWEIIRLPAPDTLRDEVGFVDWNYVNHLALNDAILACGYNEPVADQRAREVLAAAYPGRSVVMIDAREILARGGGIHCITQQQPAVPATAESA